MLPDLKKHILKFAGDPKEQLCIFAFSTFFSLVRGVASSVYNENELRICFDWYSLFIMYFLLNIFIKIIKKCYEYKSRTLNCGKLNKIFFVVLFVSSLVCWMTFWPGIISHDDLYVLLKGMGRSFQFPPFYVAFLTLCKNIGSAAGSLSYGVLFYILFQIAVISVVLAKLLTGLFSAEIPRILKYMSAAYYIFVPLFAYFSVSVVKDTMFSIALTALTLFLYDIVNKKDVKKSEWIVFYALVFFIVSLRNNGIYIIAGVISVIYILFRQYREKIITSVIVIFITSLGGSFIQDYFHLVPLFQEKVAIPLQQIAAVVKNDGVLSAEQKEFISRIAPLDNIKERYSPYTVDPFKWENPEFNGLFLHDHKYAFLKNWARIMPANFAIYTKAYLQATYGFWAPVQYRARINTCDLWIRDQKKLFNFARMEGLLDDPVFSGKTEEVLKKYYSFNSLFFQNGVLFWILVSCAFLYYLKKRSFRPLIVYFPCFALWGTLMLAVPAMDIFRYVFAFAYLLPFFVALLFLDEEKTLPVGL